MGERDRNRLAYVMAATAGLTGLLIACSKEQSPPATPAASQAEMGQAEMGQAEMGQAQVFRFAPPDGTEWVRTDRRSEELAVVGEPLRRVETEELKWRSRAKRTGDGYSVTQDLTYVSYTRDGQTLLQGTVPEGISATLLTDTQGNLTGLKGLDKTAEVLRSLVAPGEEAEAEQVITADSLGYIVATRYQVLFGDTIGRPAAPGSTWKISNPPGSVVTSRSVTVTGHEPCGNTTCARLQVQFQLDPKAVTSNAVSLVRKSMAAAGEDPSQVTVRKADYRMNGWMLVEPATMLSHGASLTEGGTVTVADSDEEMTIELRGATDLTYSYAEARSE